MHSGGSCLLLREQTVVLHCLLYFSKVRRDGVVRGLEATESDSFAVTPVWLDWDEGGDGTLETGESHTVSPGLLGKMMSSIWSRPDMTR